MLCEILPHNESLYAEDDPAAHPQDRQSWRVLRIFPQYIGPPCSEIDSFNSPDHENE